MLLICTYIRANKRFLKHGSSFDGRGRRLKELERAEQRGGDKGDLNGGSRRHAEHGASADGEVSIGRAHVGRKHRDEKHDER
jgi:hypothetical protein